MHVLGIKDLERIEQMTLSEYYYLMIAKKYERVDRLRDMYELAFAIRDAKGTENVGTDKHPKEQYRFKSSSDLFNYHENIKRVKNGEDMILGEVSTQPAKVIDNEFFAKLAEFNNR